MPRTSSVTYPGHLKNVLLMLCGLLMVTNLVLTVMLYQRLPKRSELEIPIAPSESHQKLGRVERLQADLNRMTIRLEEQKKEIARLQQLVQGASTQMEGIRRKLGEKEPAHGGN